MLGLFSDPDCLTFRLYTSRNLKKKEKESYWACRVKDKQYKTRDFSVCKEWHNHLIKSMILILF